MTRCLQTLQEDSTLQRSKVSAKVEGAKLKKFNCLRWKAKVDLVWIEIT